MNFKTEQEDFWYGEFGNKYIERKKYSNRLSSSIALFSNVLNKNINSHINSIIEFGSNIGNNLIALNSLLPDAELSAIEINEQAGKVLKENEKILGKSIKLYRQSILDFVIDYQRDFVFTCGVLIHIDPSSLNKVYDLLYNTSKKYIFIAEYYNPVPIEVDYRGNKGKLFKRDFCNELMNKFNDLKLLDYGFVYHKDTLFPKDDITWFLLEK